jgi:hypothetical protein
MRLALVIYAAAALGCGDREVSKLAKVKDAVCTCKTSSCAETALKGVPQGDVRASRRAQAIARDMLDCLAKLYDAERPSTDPDAPTRPGTPAPASARTP